MQALNSCGITVPSSSPLGKRSSHEQITVEHKRAISIPDVGINASFFEGFESKLNLLGGNIINTGKFSTLNYMLNTHTCTHTCTHACVHTHAQHNMYTLSYSTAYYVCCIRVFA